MWRFVGHALDVNELSDLGSGRGVDSLVCVECKSPFLLQEALGEI